MRVWHLASLAAVLLALAGMSTAQDSAGTQLAINFHSGSILKSVTVTGNLEIETRHGKFVIPASDISKIEFGFRVPEEDTKSLEDALGELKSDNFQTREAAALKLERLGRVAYPSLEKLVAAKNDLDMTTRVTKIMQAIERKAGAGTKLRKASEEDVIVTHQGMTLKGKITSPVLKAHEKILKDLTLPLAHLRSVTVPEQSSLFDRAFAKAEVQLDETGKGQTKGNITTNQGDVYAVVPPKNGKMVIRHNHMNNGLDPYLFVYNSAKAQIAQDDDSGGNLNALVQIDVQAGQVYYIRASSLGGNSRGEYELLISME